MLYDPEGTQFKCILQSVNDNGFLGHGTNNIKKQYNLKDGGWLKFFYCDNDKFFMNVQDRTMREVIYPKPPKVYEVDLEVYDNFICIDDSDPQEEAQQPEYKKILTFTELQATCNNMVTFI